MSCIWGLLKGQRHCELCAVMHCNDREPKTIVRTSYNTAPKEQQDEDTD